MKRFAIAVARYRRAVLVLVALSALIAGAAGPTLFDRLTGGGFDDAGAESGQVSALLEKEFGQGQPDLVLLVRSPSGVDSREAVRSGVRLTRQLEAEPGVSVASSYWTSGRAPRLRSTDGQRALILADLEDPERLAELLPSYDIERPGLSVSVGGPAMLNHEMTTIGQEDVAKSEAIVFPVTLVVLLLVFGSLLAAVLPLIVALVTMLLGIGLLWLLAAFTDLSVFSVQVVSLLGLGLAIDYSLLLVNRYREELRAGRPAADALSATMRTAGRTVAFSAVTVAVVLAGLLWFPLLAVRSVAYAGIATALLAAGTALTVLPALFAVTGERLGRAPRFRLGRRSRVGVGTAESGGGWHRLAMFVMRRPASIGLGALAIVLLLGAPVLGIELGYPDERVMPASAESRQVATTIRDSFDSGEQNALQVVVPRSSSSPDPYATRLSRLDGVARVDTSTGTYADGTRVVPASRAHAGFANGKGFSLSVVPTPKADGPALVREIRALPVVPVIRAAPMAGSGSGPAVEAPRAMVGGQAAVGVDTTETLASRLPYAAATVGLAMGLLLLLLTRSVVVPLIALLLSGLSLTASFGALVWVFQEGNLSDLLGFTANGTTESTVLVLMFGLAFGLAMDYQVFMLSRIREAYDATGSPTTAVAIGLERIGRIVTAAAVLISIVFLGFLPSGISIVKAFGIGLPLAVLLDATVVRGLLLPAVMRLCGRATWWTPRVFRRARTP